MTEYEQGFIDGIRKAAEQDRRRLEGERKQWLYSSIENPTFKICPCCGTPFRMDLGIEIKFCPTCGSKPEETKK